MKTGKQFLKTLTFLLLVSILTTSLLTLVVYADKTGVGKFVDITIKPDEVKNSDCFVSVLKLSNLESRDDVDDFAHYKFSAGWINLTAHSGDNYVFDSWVILPEDYSDYNIDNENDVLTLKTTHGIIAVTAVFEPIAYMINFNTIGDGEISSDFPITGLPTNGYIEVEAGAQPIVFFNPNSGAFISTIQITKTDSGEILDASLLTTNFGTQYKFIDGVYENYEIVISFELIGTSQTVPTGTISLFTGQGVNLEFQNSRGDGQAVSYVLTLYPEDEISKIIYDIYNTATDNDGNVKVNLFSSVQISNITVASSLNASFCDVTGDGIIDGKDGSAIAQAQKSITPNGDTNFNPEFDVNLDGHLTEEDILRVHEFLGETVEYIFGPALTETVIEGGYIYSFEIGHFSIFRCR